MSKLFEGDDFFACAVIFYSGILGTVVLGKAEKFKLTAFLLLCAFALLLVWNGSMADGYRPYMTAMSLYETGQAVLLIGALFSALVEDTQERR